MAADTTDVDTPGTDVGLTPEGERQSEEAFKNLDPDIRQRLIDTTTDPAARARLQKLAEGQPPTDKSALARTGDKGESALSVTGKPPLGLAPLVATRPAEKAPAEAVPPAKPPEAPPAPSGQIFGRTTIFHYNHDGSRDKEDPGSMGFFGTNLDDPNLVGAAVPVDILEAQFGKFTQRLPNGTYAALDTPEARETIARIKSSHVLVNAPDGRQIEVPIVDIQGSYKHWHRTLDLTLGAWKALGLSDDSYLGYSVVAGDGTTLNAQADWSDSSPLAKYYKEGGKELAGRPDSEILKAAKSRVAPDMPDEQYDRAMRDAHGEDDLKKYKARTKTPGEELSTTQDSPYYGLGAGELTRKYYDDLVKAGKIDPAKTDLVDLRQRLFPNAGPIEALSQFFDASSESRAAAGREASKEIHAASGDIYAWPQALIDFAKFFRFGTEELPTRSKADEWIGKNAHLDDLGKQFMGYLMGASQAQKAQAQVDAQRAARAEKTVAGKVGGTVGGGLTDLAIQLPELAIGGEAKAAAVAMAVYHGVSTYGREVAQKGQTQAFVDAIGQGGLAGVWRYAMNSPAGFWTLFGTSWLADTGEDTLRKYINGEKIDPVDFGIHSVFDLTSAGIFSFVTPKETFKRTGVAGELKAQEQAETERSALAKRVLGPEVSEEMVWHAPGPVVTRPVEREAFTPGELSLAAGELPSGVATSELARQARMLKPPAARGLREVHLADPEAGLKEERNSVIRAETRAMLEAKENGEIDKAAEHANRALAHLEPEEQKELAKNITTYTERFSDNGATPGEEPKEPISDLEKRMLRIDTGLGSLEILEERPIDDATEIGRHLHVEGLEKDSQLEEPSEVKTGETVELESGKAVTPESVEKEHPEGVVEEGTTVLAGGEVLGRKEKADRRYTYYDGKGNKYSGLTWAEVNELAGKLKRKKPVRTETEKPAAKTREQIMMEAAQGLIEPTVEPTEMYSGIHPAPIVRAVRKISKAVRESDPALWARERLDPGSLGEAAGRTEDVLRRQNTEAEITMSRLNAELAHEHRMNDLLKGGEKVATRQRFFAKFSRSIQKAMIIAWEKGEHVGNHYAQEIFKFHADFYKAIEALEKRFGFTYKARDFYIYHLIKGGKNAQQRFERWFNNKVAADPRWTHKRTYSQLEDLLAAGFELQTYNPEELLQRRFFSSQMAINKVAALREMERNGDAWNVERAATRGWQKPDGAIASKKELRGLSRKEIEARGYTEVDLPGLPQAVKDLGGSEGELIVRAPNGERYYVMDDVHPLLANAWDMSNLFAHRFYGPTFKALMLAKAQVVPMKLRGFAHMRHLGVGMNLSNFLNSQVQGVIHGKWTPELFWTELNRSTVGAVSNSAEVKFLRTGKGWDSLSPQQKLNVEHWTMSGSNIRNIAAQQESFSAWAHQTFSESMEKLGIPRGTRETVHGSATLLRAGFEISSAKPIFDWQFHSFVPQLKFNAVMTLRDNLLRNHPELDEPKNRWKLAREMTKIGKQVDYRNGEMFYSNLFWPKTWKQLGTNMFLSMGWNLGGFRMYAGGLHDAAVLTGKILEDHRLVTRDDVTERLTFLISYHAIYHLTAAMTNYTAVSVWNYMHPDKKQDPMPSGMDFIFPRTGDLDQQGRLKRISPVEYVREMAIWFQHMKREGVAGGTGTMLAHKLNPVISTLVEEANNRNFFGKEIADPNDPSLKQWQDRAWHILQGFGFPIALTYAPQVGPIGKKEGNWFDAAWSAVGLPPSSRSVSATDAENMIYDTRHRLQGTKRTDIDDQSYAAYNALRAAIAAKDVHTQQAARDALWKLGKSDKSIKGFETHLHKHPLESAADHIWKATPHDEQRLLLLRFSAQDRPRYYKMLTPEGQESVLKLMQLKGDRELAYFRSITDPKVLNKLSSEARRHGVSLLQQ